MSWKNNSFWVVIFGASQIAPPCQSRRFLAMLSDKTPETLWLVDYSASITQCNTAEYCGTHTWRQGDAVSVDPGQPEVSNLHLPTAAVKLLPCSGTGVQHSLIDAHDITGN